MSLEKHLVEHYPWLADNLDQDLNLTHDQKSAFLEHLRMIPEDDILSSGAKYCYGFQLLGPEQEHSNGAVFGRLMFESAFVDLVAEEFGISAESAQTLLEDYYESEVDEIKDDISDLSMSKYLMWSFLADKDDDEGFLKMDFKHLSCQLGIDASAPCFVYGHKTPEDIEMKKPTFFDAALNEFWRPGGRTEPLGKCEHLVEGLEEFVHHPNKFNFLSTLFYEL